MKGTVSMSLQNIINRGKADWKAFSGLHADLHFNKHTSTPFTLNIINHSLLCLI